MTILTKPSEKKNNEKLQIPMGAGDDVSMLHGGVASAPTMLPPRSYSPDCDAESMDFHHPTHPCLKTFMVFVISVLIMLLGIMGGYTLYRMYAPQNSNVRYHALCDIPYMGSLTENDKTASPRFALRPDDFELNWRSLFPRMPQDPFQDEGAAIDDNFFREEIELDLSDNESYAKIDVPDFKDGRRGRFMHDFKENQSAIIDTTSNRCFIMSLDRDTTMPPKSFVDLMQKMTNGYYNIDTDRVRKHMRVVTPAITDLTLISERIANECYDMKVYMLEKYISGVFKREANPIAESGKFAEFLGKGIIEFDLVNIAEIEEYENKAQQ